MKRFFKRLDGGKGMSKFDRKLQEIIYYIISYLPIPKKARNHLIWKLDVDMYDYPDEDYPDEL